MGVDLFGALSPDAIDRVAATAEARSLRRGDVLFREADPADELFLVESGRIAVVKRSADGRAWWRALMASAAVFGRMSLFHGQPRSADARALEPSVVHAFSFAELRD